MLKCKLLILGACLSFSQMAMADEYVARYVCYADNDIRQNGGGAEVNSRLELKLMKDQNGLIYLTQTLGHVLLGENDTNILSDRYAYYGFFRFGRLTENPDYDPVVYHDHYQFKPFNATVTNNTDGGGMWGSFVIPKTLETNINAHYIFQAGSHIGGTIDYKCEGRL